MRFLSWVWSFVPPQIRVIIYVALFIIWIGSYVFVFLKGAEWKESTIEAKTITNTVTIREKQNAIRDNRPSVKRTIGRMRSDTF